MMFVTVCECKRTHACGCLRGCGSMWMGVGTYMCVCDEHNINTFVCVQGLKTQQMMRIEPTWQ